MQPKKIFLFKEIFGMRDEVLWVKFMVIAIATMMIAIATAIIITNKEINYGY